MNLGAENKRQVAILAGVGAVALGAAIYIYSAVFGFGGSAPASPPPPVVTTVATPATARGTAAPTRRLATPPGTSSASAAANAAAQLDPTLHMEGMLLAESLVYTGSGRNIFSGISAPAADLPCPIASVRPPASIAPMPVSTPTGPAPPPPIDLKFFGTETSTAGPRKGFLLHGEDVFFVGSGDIVQRRYRVISVEARSIVMEDIANNNRQTLPLIGN